LSTVGQQGSYDGIVSEPAYTRLETDERRRQLLEYGADLFTRYGYDEISMAGIAREAGISKALLYHYFPSKSQYFQATLAQAAAELAARTAPDPALAPGEQLRESLGAFLTWVEERSASYAKLMQSAATVAEVRELVERIRSATAERILEGLGGDGPHRPRARTAVIAWLWFMDGACLDWLAHRDFDRDALRDQLLMTLQGALEAAGAPKMAAALAA
jgi:AcrR family transcriptional regulator